MFLFDDIATSLLQITRQEQALLRNHRRHYRLNCCYDMWVQHSLGAVSLKPIDCNSAIASRSELLSITSGRVIVGDLEELMVM